MRKKTGNLESIVDKKTVRVTTAVSVTVIAMLAAIIAMFFTTMSVLADAGSTSNSQSTISTTVPDSHNIRIEKSHADVAIEGEEDQAEGNMDNFVVDRFAKPKIQITPEKGWKITRILLNGEDVTNQLKDGYLTLEAVCEDLTLVIETAEDTSGGKTEDTDKDKDSGKDQGTPGGGNGQDSGKKTPSGKNLLNKLKSAKTGDGTKIIIWAVLLTGAGASLYSLHMYRKRKMNNE